MAFKSAELNLNNWREVYVHWSTHDFKLRSDGSIFTYKGIQNAFKALKQSYDNGKWKHKKPKPIFFNFSEVELLSKDSRKDFFDGEIPRNEKQIEAEIDKIAHASGKQGWSARYDTSYTEVEYVVFNKHVRLDMIIQNRQKTDLIQRFIKDTYSEIKRWEQALNFINIDTYLENMRESPEDAYDMEDECSEEQREQLLSFVHEADNLTKAVRILAYYSALPKQYFSRFIKYVDLLEKDRLVYFSKFPHVFFHPQLRF